MPPELLNYLPHDKIILDVNFIYKSIPRNIIIIFVLHDTNYITPVYGR